MAQSAIDWDVASDNNAMADPEIQAPVVLPVVRRRVTRRVGVVKLYAPATTYGMVASPAHGDAIFNIDDVAVCDRARLNNGQPVAFEIVDGPDGQAARHVRIDATSLPPPPDAGLVSKGWR